MVKKSTFIIFFLFFLAVPLLTHADAGVPMIAFTFPAMIVAFIPIVFIEAIVYSFSLKIKYKNAIFPSFISNLKSTLVGIPVTWAYLLLVQLLGALLMTLFANVFPKIPALHRAFTLLAQIAWFLPFEENQYNWMVPTAAAIGLIPTYFISIKIEFEAIKKYFKDVDEFRLKQVVKKANTVTYIILFIYIPVSLYILFIHFW